MVQNTDYRGINIVTWNALLLPAYLVRWDVMLFVLVRAGGGYPASGPRSLPSLWSQVPSQSLFPGHFCGGTLSLVTGPVESPVPGPVGGGSTPARTGGTLGQNWGYPNRGTPPSTGADPGLVVGGDADPLGWSVDPIYLYIF